MRILVMFDLPVGSKKERRSYTEFRTFLIENGYTMLQFSVYTRITLGRDLVETHIERLRRNLPQAGAITVLVLTEKQFEDRLILLGHKPKPSSANDYGAQLTLFL